MLLQGHEKSVVAMNNKTLPNNRGYATKPVCYNVDITLNILPDNQRLYGRPMLPLSTWPVYVQLAATVHTTRRDIASIALEFHSRAAKASTQHFAPEIRHFSMTFLYTSRTYR